MTNEEAEQLIAEIDIYRNCVNSQLPPGAIKDIAKIIKRFANKPPYKSICNDFDVEVNYIPALGKDYPLNICFTENKEINYWYSFNLQQLKQLRDNISKMLEWLENE